jgi:hypothetical protein
MKARRREAHVLSEEEIDEIVDWLRRVIVERMDLEEAAFASLKRDLQAQHNG